MFDRNELIQLSEDLTYALTDLYEYKVVFSNDPERLSLLNNTAPFFFVKLYKYYWDEFIMSISRFTDPGVQRNFKNLSILSLKEYSDLLPPDGKAKFLSNLDTIVVEAEIIRNYRNKNISHRSKEAQVIIPEKMETFNVDKVEKIYTLIEDCLNIFYGFFDNTTEFHGPIIITHGAQTMLNYLSEGKLFEEMTDKSQMLKMTQPQEST